MNFLTLNTKPFVLSVNSSARIYSQIHAEFIFCLVLRQALDLVQSEPKSTNEKITESLFKIFPGAVEINNAIHSLLDHCPSSTSCRLITIHIKGTWTIRVDFINTTDGLAAFVKLSAVLICWEKKNSRLVIFLGEIIIPRSDLTQNSTSLRDRRKKVFDEMFFCPVTSERPGKRVVNLIFPMDIWTRTFGFQSRKTWTLHCWRINHQWYPKPDNDDFGLFGNARITSDRSEISDVEFKHSKPMPWWVLAPNYQTWPRERDP